MIMSVTPPPAREQEGAAKGFLLSKFAYSLNQVSVLADKGSRPHAPFVLTL
jgi:hypothetical protein